jgi:hypothetical protein
MGEISPVICAQDQRRWLRQIGTTGKSLDRANQLEDVAENRAFASYCYPRWREFHFIQLLKFWFHISRVRRFVGAFLPAVCSRFNPEGFDLVGYCPFGVGSPEFAVAAIDRFPARHHPERPRHRQRRQFGAG